MWEYKNKTCDTFHLNHKKLNHFKNSNEMLIYVISTEKKIINLGCFYNYTVISVSLAIKLFPTHGL